MKTINHNVRLWDWEKKREDDGEVIWSAACPSHPESRYWVQRSESGRFYISDAYGAAYGDFSNPLAAMLSVERMWIAESV